MENTDSKEANYDTNILNQLPSCYAGWSFARVMANGDVNSCLKSFKIPIGNIFKDSFKDIWFGKKQEIFRKHTIDYNPKNPYFKNMGSDHTQEEQGCIKCCDNLGFNMHIHGKLQSLSPTKKKLLKIGKYL
jgi:MoaA/NifB/PqqE/SkfB family radical SAM enzyme